MLTIIHLSGCLFIVQLLQTVAAGTETTCQDERPSCRKIGTRLPLSRCYRKTNECCVTCSELRSSDPGCPYGDRASGCGSIGGDRPISDCYAENATCCGTCALYSRGTPGCEYGDRLNWCSEIGSRFLVSSCYREEEICCDTCARFKENVPGCEYGDHENWCSLIGLDFCKTKPDMCCATCAKLMGTTAAPLANATTMTHAPDIVESSTVTHSTVHHDTSVQTPYTGFAGRPSVQLVTTSPHSNSAHSTSSVLDDKAAHPKTPDLNNTNSTLDKSPNQTKNSNGHDPDVTCYYVNATGHRIRHNKHGGRHRSRGHRPLCGNMTSSHGTEATVAPSTTEPLWLIISKGMPPQRSTTPSTPRTTKTIFDISKQENEVSWTSESPPIEGVTTKFRDDWQGEMYYQEDNMSAYGSASYLHSKSAACSVLSLHLSALFLYSSS